MVPYNGPHDEYLKLFKEAVEEKKISMHRLNDAATRILFVKLKLGLFEKQLEHWQAYIQFASLEFKKAAKKAPKKVAQSSRKIVKTPARKAAAKKTVPARRRAVKANPPAEA